MSCWRRCSSSDDLICLKHLVSSANSRALLQWMASGRSFMYKINRRGPRILPWYYGKEIRIRIVNRHKLKSVSHILFKPKPKNTRNIKCGQLLKQVRVTDCVKNPTYIQINGVQLMMGSKCIRQEQQQLLCFRLILHESKLGWIYLTGNMIN